MKRNYLLFVMSMTALLCSCEISSSIEKINSENESQHFDTGLLGTNEKTIPTQAIKKGIYGPDEVDPGSIHYFSAQFWDGGNNQLGEEEEILWIMQGTIHEQYPLVHYVDCEFNGDCDGQSEDNYPCEGPDSDAYCVCNPECDLPEEIWYEINTSTQIKVKFPENIQSASYVILATLSCGNECYHPTVSKEVNIAL